MVQEPVAQIEESPEPEVAPEPVAVAAPESAVASAAPEPEQAAPSGAAAEPEQAAAPELAAAPAEPELAAAPAKKPKFTAESGLGFMHLFQFSFAFNILVFCVALIFIKGSTVSLMTYGSAVTIFSAASQGLMLWLITARKKAARLVITIVFIILFLNTVISELVEGIFMIEMLPLSVIAYGIPVLYFNTSRRAKAVLVRPFESGRLRDIQAEKMRQMWDPKSKDFWFRLILYFFAFSIIGHWMEMGVQILIINGLFPGTLATPDSLTWRDSWNPFFIYGIAVAFCGLALYPLYLWLRRKLSSVVAAHVLSFLVNTAFCVVAELILGLNFNADLHAWDYSNQFMNWHGQICLLYSFAFGVMSSLITWLIYPLMERFFGGMRRDAFRIVFVIAFVLFALIVVTYNIDLDDLMPGSNMTINASSAAARAPAITYVLH